MRSPVQSRLPLPRKSESYEVRSSFFCFRVKGLSGIRSLITNMMVVFLMMINPHLYLPFCSNHYKIEEKNILLPIKLNNYQKMSIFVVVT